jgi:hypothetical protein
MSLLASLTGAVATGVPTAPLPHATWLPTYGAPNGDDGEGGIISITWLAPPPPPTLSPPSGGDDATIGGVNATCGCGNVWWGALGRVGARGSTAYLDLAELALHSRRMCPGHKGGREVRQKRRGGWEGYRQKGQPCKRAAMRRPMAM